MVCTPESGSERAFKRLFLLPAAAGILVFGTAGQALDNFRRGQFGNNIDRLAVGRGDFAIFRTALGIDFLDEARNVSTATNGCDIAALRLADAAGAAGAGKIKRKCRKGKKYAGDCNKT